MKEKFFILIVVIFSMLAIPLSALSKAESTPVSVAGTIYSEPYTPASAQFNLEEIRVLIDGTVTNFSTRDYLFGVIAAEMPALYEAEALKAQTIAAYTFALYRVQGNKSKDYDITSDGETAQCFITRDEAAKRWGDKANEYTKKIDDCIAAVAGEWLSYNNQPIFAAYHAISPGVTNNCKDVWGEDIPYLKSVESVGDRLSEGYLSEVTLSADEVSQKLKSISETTVEPSAFFTNANTSETGFVKSVDFCGKTVSGSQLRDLLGLRSSNFTIDYADKVFKFTVTGYGHGVGMSQTGANYMAKQGKTYKEILLHYYSGAALQKN